MNYRQKCKQKGAWAFIKYKHNAAIYAACQNCGYTYACYSQDGPPWQLPLKPGKPHRYCPNCGLKMHLWDEERVYKEGIDF